MLSAALVFFLLVRLVAKVPVVQTWLVQKAAAYLSGQLGVQVGVKAVDIRFFRSISLQGVFVQDQQRDTLLYAPELEVTISRLSISDRELKVKNLLLEGARIQLKRYPATRSYNFDFIVDYFSSGAKDTTPSAPWKVTVEGVDIRQCHFTYLDLKDRKQDNGIDWEAIDLHELNVQLADVIPSSDSLTAHVHHIAFREKSGFRLTGFRTNAVIKAGDWRFTGLQLKTERSDVRLDLRFAFNEMTDFEDFISKVNCKGDFASSFIDFRDLMFFAPELKNLNRGLTFSGTVRGTVDKFKGKNLNIRYTDQTYFKGNVNMTGLPDFFETYMEVAVEDLAFNHADLMTVPQWPFDSLKNLQLPEEIKRLGEVHFKGNFNGFYNDFVAYGNITSAVGYISSDLNLKIGDSDRETSYKGNIRLHDVDVGYLAGVKGLGRVSLKASLEGTGVELRNIQARVEGDIAAIDYNQYRYSDIHLNGRFSKKMFTGEVIAADKHLDMDFQGSIDFNGSRPLYNFTSSIRKADLTQLHWLDRSEDASLSADITINMTGNNLDDAEGVILLEQVAYSEDGKTVEAEQIYLENRLGDRREFSLLSDFADLRVAGQYTFSEIPRTISYFIGKYVPAVTASTCIRPEAQELSFKGRIKRSTKLLEIFSPGLSVAHGSIFEGNLNTGDNNLALLVRSDEIKWSGVNFEGIHIDGHTDGESFRFNTLVEHLQATDSISLQDMAFKGFTNRDTSSVFFELSGDDSTKTAAAFSINAGFLSTGYTSIKVVPQKLLLSGHAWTLDSNNYILADTTGLLFHEFAFSRDTQSIAINGIIGADTTAGLLISFHHFEAAQLNDLLSDYHINIGGVTDGTATLSGLTGKPALDADLSVKDIQWYGDTLGSAEFHARWDSKEDKVSVLGEITRGGIKNIQISGAYYLLEKGDRLDFTARLQKTYLRSFAHYLEGLASDVSGIASGELYLRGSSARPELTGKVILQKVGFTIDYLQTSYSFSTEVTVLKDKFVIRDLALNDIKGNQAIVNGEIRHRYLDDFYLDFDIKAKKTQVLNTGKKDNDVFYGVAYATGNVSIKGPLDYMVMDIGLAAEKGTSIFMPLSNPEEVTRSGFITFINKEQQAVEEPAGPDFSGIELNMEFDINTNARLSLIFDEKIGDVIEGYGEGTLTMKISPSEDLRMWGNVSVESGKYLFTMQNVINKSFTIEKGGSIKWSGNPYQATIDISALYSRRVGLYDLFQDSSFRKLTPVDLKLHLTNELFNPNISFDIKVHNVDPNTETQIKRLINTEEEMYRQAVSLLVMSRFTTPSEISNRSNVSSSNVVGMNAYEMLSNQLSNWASQISNQVNFGVNYRPGDALTSEELQVAMSTSLFNDRVTIDGNVGVANTGTNTNNQNTSNLVGDFNVEVKASRDGHIRLKAFNRSNNNSLINNVNSQYTQGLGAFYRVEFNTFGDLYQKIRDLFRKKSRKRMRPPDAESKKEPSSGTIGGEQK